ncbi:MAG: helix-turn-helix domain-containing protein [Proteobacteria bacterium]|nr:helix-turn-helix domain-containing protein [Pseudomonadota bacterium]
MSKTKKEEDRERQQAAESESIGSYLRRLRSEKGLSVEEVSSSTRISATNVRAIEGLEFDKLPADAFTRGQLNIYADFLGIDPAYLVNQFMKERDESRAAGRRAGPREAQKVLAPKTMAEPSRISSAAVAGFLLLLIVVLFTAFCLYTSWSPFNFLRKETAIIGVFPGNRAAPPQQDQAGGQKQPSTPATAPEKSPATEQKSQNKAPPAGATTKIPTARYSLTVRFSKNTGVTVTRDGGAMLSMFFKSGTEQTWKAGKSLKLVFARPGSATLLLNGKALAFPVSRNGRPTLLIPEDLPNHQ